MKKRKNKKSRGFTLIEVLLSVALATVIVGIGIPVYQSLRIRNDLDVAAVEIVATERRAQALARASDGDTTWGISVQSGSITLFRGASYATRDAGFDEVFELSSSIAPSGTTEFVFDMLTGFPQTTGTLTLTSNTNETRIIVTNAKGTISY